MNLVYLGHIFTLKWTMTSSITKHIESIRMAAHSDYTAGPDSDTFVFVESKKDSTGETTYLHTMRDDKETIISSKKKLSVITIDGEWLYFSAEGMGVYRIHMDGSGLQKVGNTDAQSSQFLGFSQEYLVFINGGDHKQFIFIPRIG